VSIATLPEQVASTLSQLVPGLATCEEYAGQFSAGELRKASFRAPAIFTALLRAKAQDPGTGELAFTAEMAAYVIWKAAKTRAERSSSAAALAEAVALAIRGQQWGLDGIRPAAVSEVQNLHSATLDRQGMSLYVVKWSQMVLAGDSIWVEDGTLPTEVCAGFTPDVGAGNEASYEAVVDAQ